jgi:hypothetical protein
MLGADIFAEGGNRQTSQLIRMQNVTPPLCPLHDFTHSQDSFQEASCLLLALGGWVESHAGTICGICWDRAEGSEDTLF